MERRRGEGGAPGRLDVLGGVADYSGALVLQTPLRATTRVTVTERDDDAVTVASGPEAAVVVPRPEPSDLVSPEGDPARLRGWLDDLQVPKWARYSLGCLVLFGRVVDWRPPRGLSIDIRSDVPVSMGVSSSAALEVATLRALEELSGRSFAGTSLARLAQRVENEVVGAPCGLMDQLAAAHGTAGALLPILCRPDILGDPVRLPEGVLVAGWPSGVRHAVSDAPYATARTAAFMGKVILERATGQTLPFLTEFAPSVVHDVGDEVLPRSICGSEFVSRYGGVDDPLSRISFDRDYPVRAAATFAVEEHFRSSLTVQLLGPGRPTAGPLRCVAETIGELMYQSHAGYDGIGLGCPETTAMVEAVRAAGPGRGFFGARASGGGCGGTVVVLLRADALPRLVALAEAATFGPRQDPAVIL